MLLKRALLMMALCLPLSFMSVGCGGGVEEGGVADGPSEPEPELTEEEEQNEEAYVQETEQN